MELARDAAEVVKEWLASAPEDAGDTHLETQWQVDEQGGKAKNLTYRYRVAADLTDEGRRLAIEVNGEIIPRSAHADALLHDGDRVEIVQAIGGG